MKKTFYFLIVVFIVSLLAACKEKSASENCETFVIPENIINNVFEWPASMRITNSIRLETNDESLLGSIFNVMIEDGKIFVKEYKTTGLKVFSEQDGKFLFKAGNKGQGPGEFSEFRDFCLNLEKKEIYMLDYGKILCYDMNTGKFMRKIDMDIKINPMEFYWDGLFYLWNTEHSLLSQWDTKHIVNGFLPHKNFVVYSNQFRMHGNSCLVMPPTGDYYVYEIIKDKCYPKYYIDYGKLVLPSSMVLTKENLDEIWRSSYIHTITEVWETNQWLYVLAIGYQSYQEALINKETKEIIAGKPNFSLNAIRVIYAKDNEFYALVEAPQIKESSKESILHSLSDLNLNEMDNPVIIKFSL